MKKRIQFFDHLNPVIEVLKRRKISWSDRLRVSANLPKRSNNLIEAQKAWVYTRVVNNSSANNSVRILFRQAQDRRGLRTFVRVEKLNQISNTTTHIIRDSTKVRTNSLLIIQCKTTTSTSKLASPQLNLSTQNSMPLFISWFLQVVPKIHTMKKLLNSTILILK